MAGTKPPSAEDTDQQVKALIAADKATTREAVILLLEDNPVAVNMVVAWPNVDRSLHQGIYKSLREVWRLLEYSRDQWADLANTTPDAIREMEPCLIGNGIIYPDGTIPQIVADCLAVKVGEMLGVIEKPKGRRRGK